MTILNPTQLVDEFKKSGEFDRLRRELLTQFQRGDGIASFKSRIEDIAQQRLGSDQKLQYMPQESVHRELMQEMDRYPVVERAVADVRMLSDPSFAADIRSSVQRILREDRGQKPQPRTGNGNTVKSVRADVKPKLIHIPKPPNHTQHEAPSQPPSEPVLAEVVAEPRKARLNGPPPASTPAEPQLTSAEAQGVEKMDTAVTANIDIVMSDSERLVAESAIATTAGVQYVNDMATDAGESEPATNTLPAKYSIT